MKKLLKDASLASLGLVFLFKPSQGVEFLALRGAVVRVDVQSGSPLFKLLLPVGDEGKRHDEKNGLDLSRERGEREGGGDGEERRGEKYHAGLGRWDHSRTVGPNAYP